ncbi:hypothetical protein [Burkholderia gladioli]|uniref:hypothetical protein n=1 Tax=Burkholderia gladioli TaxID=28095 RepID=UPI001640FF1D|nr:hypothetical protein [Burkholderia gladioli]
MSIELISQDATRLAELIRNKEVSPVEVVKAHLDRIEAVDPKLNAIVNHLEISAEPRLELYVQWNERVLADWRVEFDEPFVLGVTGSEQLFQGLDSHEETPNLLDRR